MAVGTYSVVVKMGDYSLNLFQHPASAGRKQRGNKKAHASLLARKRFGYAGNNLFQTSVWSANGMWTSGGEATARRYRQAIGLLKSNIRPPLNLDDHGIMQL